MSVPTLSKPPGRPDESYIIPFMGGELWTIPTSNSVMRMVVTGEESKGDFAVITTGGAADQPIGFHYHKEAHDVFLCLKGHMNVWANDQGRTLAPGDFASVPPMAIHSYQILGPHSEFVGLIVPGGWEEFFRFIGEPYASPFLFPTADKRNPMQVLIPKLMAATEKFDMIPVRSHERADPTHCSAASDSTLPTKEREPYFLKADAGPKWAAGGLLVKPLARPQQTDGKFAIARIEGVGAIDTVFADRKLTFASSHHAFLIDAGEWSFKIGAEAAEAQTVRTGETVFVPAGVPFSLSVLGAHGAAYVFASGGGLVEVLIGAGSSWEAPVISEDFPTGLKGELEAVGEKWGLKL